MHSRVSERLIMSRDGLSSWRKQSFVNDIRGLIHFPLSFSSYSVFTLYLCTIPRGEKVRSRDSGGCFVLQVSSLVADFRLGLITRSN